MVEFLAMSDVRAIDIDDYSPSGEWRAMFRMKPVHRREIVFGFLLRLIIGLFAVVFSTFLMALIGAVNGWRFTPTLLIVYGTTICVIVLVGEHVRSRIYERSVKLVEPESHLSKATSDELRSAEHRLARKFGRQTTSLTDLAIKRGFDIVVVSLTLLAFLPLMLVIAIAIKFDSPGPVLVRLTRRGFNGRFFYALKFRTVFYEEGGPRVTRAGRYLRATSLDELPQLFNVLAGDMSFVGPRPAPLSYHGDYEEKFVHYALLHGVKPGLTGWAQVHGLRDDAGHVETIKRRLAHDDWYIQNWSVWLDILIIFHTLAAVLRGRDAY
jgi:lipopolysaccharide/colanic/teichoic acid biosynthesis glycosyltransferase